MRKKKTNSSREVMMRTIPGVRLLKTRTLMEGRINNNRVAELNK